MDWYRFLPRYWIQTESTDRAWDEVLNALLDQHEPKISSQHTVGLGPVTVWVSNWPYAYGYCCRGGFPFHGLPTVATRKRLRKAVTKASLAKIGGQPS